MPRESIVGSGRKGFGFEQKGFQERNLALLLETLSKKEVQKSIEALAKFEKDEWVEMANTATSLNNFVALGGVSTLTSSIKETIKLQIDSLLSPLKNELNQGIAELINPLLEILTPVINDLTTFLADNAVGAGVGGIAGLIASKFLPGGSIWLILFALVGSVFEDEITKFFEGERSALSDTENFWPVLVRLWEYFWGGGTGGGTGGGGSSGSSNALPGSGRIGGFQDVF